MRTSTAILGALAVGATGAMAQVNDTYLAGLATVLAQLNLTTFATTAASLNNSVQGQALLSQLPHGNSTLLVPNNAAFASAGNISSDKLLETLTYHLVSGNFTGVNVTAPNHVVGRTYLNASDAVALEGNKSQVLVWEIASNGTATVLNQSKNVTVKGTAQYQNLNIYVIDAVLSIPGNVTTVAASAGLTSLTTFLTQQNLASVFQTQHGYTVFAPNDAAFASAQASLAGLAGNTTAIQAVLLNHVINGTSVYSPTLLGGGQNFTSAAGEPFSFTSNSTGSFVTNGQTSAQIIRTDVLVNNGVIHVIDKVLANTATDTSAASSAYASATSIAGKTTTETGPVGAPTSSSSGKTNGAVSLGVNFANIVGAVVMLLGVGVGAVAVL